MSLFNRLLIPALLSIAVATPAVAAGDFQVGGGFKIYKAQLGIKSPAGPGCPAAVQFMTWVYMSHPTTIEIMFVRKGQPPSQPISITSKKASNGQYVATYSKTVNFPAPIDAEYRVLVGGGSGTVTNWVPVHVAC